MTKGLTLPNEDDPVTLQEAVDIVFRGTIKVSTLRVVRHTCDNRLCCNPRHLVLGTQKDNVRDAMERGRHYIPNKGGGR